MWSKLQQKTLKYQRFRTWLILGVLLPVFLSTVFCAFAPKASASVEDCIKPDRQAQCSEEDKKTCKTAAYEQLISGCSVEAAAGVNCNLIAGLGYADCVRAQMAIILYPCKNTGDQEGFDGCINNARNAANNLHCDNFNKDKVSNVSPEDSSKCALVKNQGLGCSNLTGDSAAACYQYADKKCEDTPADKQKDCHAAHAGKLSVDANGDQAVAPQLACEVTWDFSTLFSLRWITCPIINGMTAAAGLFENTINSLLNIDVGGIFTDTSKAGGKKAQGNAQAGAHKNADGYHKAWNSFRLIALSIVVIATLVMVLAQAAGLELLDAYTIRKVLPRLLFATVCIALSWDILQFLVTLSNDVGIGVRGLIYAPFKQLKQSNITIGGGSAAITALIGAGGALAFGWPALLLLALSALLATLTALATLLLREMLIILLVMMAPFAMACYILPNTQKLWDFWRKTFLSLLIVFPIISGFIAIGRVFAITSLNTGGDGTVNQLIAIFAYFAPYFLIPTAFNIAGGLMAQVSGLLNKAAAPLQGALKQARSNEMKKRGEKWRGGQLFKNNNAIGRAINEAGLQVGSGRMGLGSLLRGDARARGRARQFTIDQAARRLKEDPRFASFAEEDAVMLAMIKGGTHQERYEKLKDFLQRRAVREQIEAAQEANREKGGNGELSDKALAAASTLDAHKLGEIDAEAKTAADQAHTLGYGSAQRRAALRATLEHGRGIMNQDEQAELIADATEGDFASKLALAGEANYINKQNNRQDLAGGAGNIANHAEAIAKGDKKLAEQLSKAGAENALGVMGGYDMAQLKAPGYKNAMRHIQSKIDSAQQQYAQASATQNTTGMQQAIQHGIDAGVALAAAEGSQMYSSGANNAMLNKALNRSSVKNWLKRETTSTVGPTGAEMKTLYEIAESRSVAAGLVPGHTVRQSPGFAAKHDI